MKPYYFSFSDIHKLVKTSAQQILMSGFTPDFIVAIGAGGLVPARLLKTFLKKPIITVTVCSYDDAKQHSMGTIQKIQWLDGVEITGKKLLLVDDIDDSRATIEFCLNELLKQQPQEIATYVLHDKNKAKIGKFPSQVRQNFVGERVEDYWIYYPWEMEDLGIAFADAV